MTDTPNPYEAPEQDIPRDDPASSVLRFEGEITREDYLRLSLKRVPIFPLVVAMIVVVFIVMIQPSWLRSARPVRPNVYVATNITITLLPAIAIPLAAGVAVGLIRNRAKDHAVRTLNRMPDLLGQVSGEVSEDGLIVRKGKRIFVFSSAWLAGTRTTRKGMFVAIAGAPNIGWAIRSSMFQPPSHYLLKQLKLSWQYPHPRRLVQRWVVSQQSPLGQVPENAVVYQSKETSLLFQKTRQSRLVLPVFLGMMWLIPLVGVMAYSGFQSFPMLLVLFGLSALCAILFAFEWFSQLLSASTGFSGWISETELVATDPMRGVRIPLDELYISRASGTQWMVSGRLIGTLPISQQAFETDDAWRTACQFLSSRMQVADESAHASRSAP